MHKAERMALSVIQVLLAVTPAVGIVALAGCSEKRHETPVVVTSATAGADAEYVGNRACSACHPSEYEKHRTSRHAITMRPADLRSLGALAPSLGPIGESHYAIREIAGGALRFERTDKSQIGATLGYALGSGKDAWTFIGEFTPTSLTEFRMTYLPPQRRWLVTPGQQTAPNLNLGDRHQLGLAAKCVHCHAVKTSPGSMEPAPGYLGVGCESCHGPGAPHIAAVEKGDADLKMADISKMGAAEIDAVCARCHRSIDDITLDGADASTTSRFQGYALELSACFKGSHNTLSCITCHDAHTNVSTDTTRYEKICLTCHSPGGSSGGKVCPVNPTTKCIGCHMPNRPIMLDERIPISMSDHLIMAYPAKQ